ncbi:hypothetical protein [Rhizobacter sp. OV335]|uniref:hypothetical protein n=1 Tax=Rhizobacter sp. OV335 TaxID=1500264 RepID=UPI00092085E5|nr:hypothetical protein [Rhizobacter sp. OV335]SHN35678.1 hypothetical protein SAMN02787076_05507 [Rhizobacter sp. OV335]
MNLPQSAARLVPLSASLAAALALTACANVPNPFGGAAAPAPAGAEAPAAAPAVAATLPEVPSAAPAARTAVLNSTYAIDGAIMPVMRGQQLTETRTDMRRNDSVLSFDNRLLRTFAGDTRSSDITRLDRKLVWTQNIAKKTYTECPLTGCPRPAQPQPDKPKPPEQPSKPSEPSCPLVLKKNELKVVATGERKAISAYNSERFQINWVMELEDPQGRRNSNRVQLDLWTTPEVGAVKEVQAITQAFQSRHAAAVSAGGEHPFGKYLPKEVMGSMGALLRNLGGANAKTTAAWGNELKKVRGYPMAMTLAWTADGNACGDDASAARGNTSAPSVGSLLGGLMGGGGGDGKPAGGPLLSYSYEVRTLDVKAVSDGWFTPDAGFQRAQ